MDGRGGTGNGRDGTGSEGRKVDKESTAATATPTPIAASLPWETMISCFFVRSRKMRMSFCMGG